MLFRFSASRLLCLIILFFGILLLSESCIPARKGLVLHGLQPGRDSIDRLAMEASKLIYPGDQLLLQVFYPGPGDVIFDAGSAASGMMGMGAGMQGQQGGAGGTGGVGQNASIGMGGSGMYLVDKEGMIEVIGLGKLKVANMKPEEIAQLLKVKLSALYQDVFVRCSYTGRVLFLGAQGGSLALNNDRLSILDALAIRGLGDPTARRDRVWVIRETNNTREYGLVDLTSKELYRSPFFYLRNNDMIYLEPNKINTFLVVNQPVRNIITAVTSTLAFALSLWAIFR